ncbi:MAG: PAS domain S-box protein, partial [Victivallaceae bacterium]
GFVAMKANTAIGFILAGLSLALLAHKDRSGFKTLLLARASAVVMTLIGALTLCQYLFDIDFRIDQLLFLEPANAIDTLSPGRMAPSSAIDFILLGIALLIVEHRRWITAAQGLALITGFIGLLPLMGYLYGATSDIGVGHYTQMAVHTSVLFIGLALGVMLLHPADGFMRQVTSNTFGGWLLRNLTPLMVAVPIVLGWLWVKGDYYSYFESEFGVVLAMCSMMALLMALVLWSATELNRLDSVRQQSEARLRASEERNRAILQTAMDGFWTADMQGHLLEVNDTYCRMSGYNAEELLAMRIADLEVNTNPYDATARIQNLLEKGEDRFETRHRRRDGAVFDVEISVQYRAQENKLVAFIRDITERKRAEKALNIEQENMKAVFAAAPVGMLLLDDDGIIVNSNTVIAQLLSRDQCQITQRRTGNGLGCIHSTEDERGCGFSPACAGCPLRSEIQQVLALRCSIHGKEMPYDVLIDGQEQHFWLSVNAEPLMLNGRKHVVVAIDDITDRKNSEAELVKAKERAEESDRLKSAFLANMSHEIRTPMNGILGFTELLKEPKLTGEEQLQYISIIEQSGERMLNTINDIINISKIEAGQMEISISETNINEQIEYIYAFFKPEVEQKGMSLSFKNPLPAKDAIIKTDREKIYAVLTNLVKNAIKFTFTGSIELGYEKKGEFLEFFVKDTGIGIPQDKQKAVFDRFVQVNPSDKRAFQGSGLGLSISKAYVEMLGGNIWEESEVDKGTVFYFTIPYNHAPDYKDTISRDTAVEANICPLKPLKILIVEDDEKSEMLITLTVRKFCKELLKAKNGIDAVELCRNNPDLDLVLMDIEMPGMNGYEAARQIRQFNDKVIIIAQTAYALTGDQQKAIAAGCNDYIAKPFRQAALIAMLQKHFADTPA